MIPNKIARRRGCILSRLPVLGDIPPRQRIRHLFMRKDSHAHLPSLPAVADWQQCDRQETESDGFSAI